jgi:hypothetical protein
MTSPWQRLLVLFGVVLVTMVLAPDAQSMLVAGAALAIAALIAARFGAVASGSREIRVGHRSRAHREVYSYLPDPSHPATPGRTRARAPGGAVPAAL